MNNQKLNDLAERYYKFILHYRKSDVPIDTKNCKELTPKQQKILKALEYQYISECEPWEFLTKGQELAELKKIFVSNDEEMKKYINVGDYVSDMYFEAGFYDLKKYYQEHGIKYNRYTIYNELDSYINKQEIDKSRFSKETINQFELAKELTPITDELEKIYIGKKMER